jgi:predicted NBD/HSP70 family sugar kinase
MKQRRILVIDIGGSHVKALATGRKQPVEIPSGPGMTPQQLVAAAREATAGWNYEVVSIGYPGQVVRGRPAEDAPNLGKGWVGFDFERALGRRVKLVNDAAMQALGSYRGGTMLFLGFGTGLGSALIFEGILHPMELGDLPYLRNRPYADYVGKAALKRMGRARWSRHALTAVRQLKAAIQADYVVLGGGEAKLLKKLPPRVLQGDNSKAFLGGFRLWQQPPRKSSLTVEPA